LKNAPHNFDDETIAIHRICRARGWTLLFFENLTDEEKDDLFADDYRRQDFLNHVLEQFNARTKSDKSIDMGAYIQTLLAKM
jgi:hypothetical protein